MSGKERISPSRGSLPWPASTRAVKALMAPRNRLPEMFSRWPRNFSHWPGGRDVVGGALALGLHEDRQPLVVVAVPRRERLEQLEAIGVGARRRPRRRRTVGRRARNPDSPGSKPSAGELARRRAGRALTPSISSVSGLKSSVPLEGIGDDHVRRRDERLGVGVAVVALREVPVVAVDDRVDLGRVEVGALPLADAGPAGVGQHRRRRSPRGRPGGRRARWWPGPARSRG